MCQMLQSPNHFCSPSLDSPQYVQVSSVLVSPELDPAHQVCLTRAKQKGRIFSLTSDTTPSSAWEAVGFLCCEGSFLALGEPGIHQDPQGFFCKAFFLQVLVDGVIPPQGLDFVHPFAELLRFLSAPFSACQGPSAKQHNHHLYQPLLTIPYPVYQSSYHLIFNKQSTAQVAQQGISFRTQIIFAALFNI